MKRFMTDYCQSVLAANVSSPAHAQFFGDTGFEQMQQFASMLEMMKKKMGKKFLAQIGVMNAQSIGAITQMFETSHGPCHRRGRFVRLAHTTDTATPQRPLVETT